MIILEKTINYLQQVIAENDQLKKSVASLDNDDQDSDSVALQAMKNKIAILEKENEFLRHKLHFLLDDSVDDMIVGKESEKPVVASISPNELVELKALEMIRKLLDSVQTRHGQGGRIQEALKELSVKKMKMMYESSTKSDLDQSCIPFPSSHSQTEVKRKQKQKETTTKSVKTEPSVICKHVSHHKTQQDDGDR